MTDKQNIDQTLKISDNLSILVSKSREEIDISNIDYVRERLRRAEYPTAVIMTAVHLERFASHLLRLYFSPRNIEPFLRNREDYELGLDALLSKINALGILRHQHLSEKFKDLAKIRNSFAHDINYWKLSSESQEEKNKIKDTCEAVLNFLSTPTRNFQQELNLPTNQIFASALSMTHIAASTIPSAPIIHTLGSIVFAPSLSSSTSAL